MSRPASSCSSWASFFDANQTLRFVALILAHQGFERAAQRRDETGAGHPGAGPGGGSADAGDRGQVGGARQGLRSSGVELRDRIGGRLDRSERRGCNTAGHCGGFGEDGVTRVAGNPAALRSCGARVMRMPTMHGSGRAHGRGENRQRQQKAGRRDEGETDAHRGSGVVNKSNTRVPDPKAGEK